MRFILARGGKQPKAGSLRAKGGRTDEEVYRMAFREILENVEAVKDFDALGHLDYVVRYGKNKEKEY